MISLGSVPASTVVYIPFSTYAGSTGASVTCSGLAVTDVEIYKNGSTTQRSSDAGISLLDTDGIDFDGITGLHGFSIDLSDNTDSGFYAVGSWYWVVVSAITVDSQTVTFLAAVFRIAPAESITGYPKNDVHALGGGAQSLTDLKDFADDGYDPATNKVQGVVLTDTVTNYTGNTPQTGDSYPIVSGGSSGNAALKTLIDTLTAYVDTEVAAIKAKTDNLPSDPADASDVAAAFSTVNATLATIAAYIDTEVAAIKAKTDNLPGDPADASDIAASFSSLSSTLSTIASYIDTEVAAIKVVTDKVNTAMVLDGSVYQFTANALELAPSGSGGSSADTFSYVVVERSPDDENPIIFEWPNNSDTLTVTRQLTSGGITGSFGAATGAATFVRTRSDGVHLWKLAYNAADRPTEEGLAVYKIVGSVYTTERELTLRVESAELDVLYNELAAPPAALSSLRDKLTWLFMWSRNRSNQTTTQRKLYADDTTTVVSTEVVSDNGTTFEKGEAS